MKKFLKQLTTLVMAAILFASTISCAGAAVKRFYGDVNADGSVTVVDARLALRAAIGLEDLDAEQTGVADIDENGEVSVADARMILRAAVKLEDLGAYEIIEDGLLYIIKIYKKSPFVVIERKK